MTAEHDGPSNGAGESLVVVAGRERRRVDGARPFVVGRAPQADLSLDDELVSRVHLVLVCEDGVWWARDESSNGTFHAGRRLTREQVRQPMTLRLGDAESGAEVQLIPQATEPPAFSERLSGVHADLRTRVRIGRAADNDIVVADLNASRHHAELTLRADGSWELVDLGSANGTYVNGRPVGRAVLAQLDVVGIGRSSFRLVGRQLEEYVDDGRVTFAAVDLGVRSPAGRPLLEGVTFRLQERSMLAVIGPSGSGKSTLMRALTCSRPAQRGQVLYDGRDLYADYEELRTRIGYVPQEGALHDPLTVHETLTYAAQLRFPSDVGGDERARRVDEVIGELGLIGVRGARVATLSGGQRRRVAVGVELLTKPSLLFLDEPAAGLDAGFERELMELLRALADGNRTIVLVTHSVQSLRLCDRVLVLAPGGVTAYYGPAQLATAFFGRDDLQEVFRDLTAHPERDWAARFLAHEYHERFAEAKPAAPPALPAGRRPRAPRLPAARRWLSQLWLQTRRYARVVAGDRRNVALLVAQPVLLGALLLVALPAGELAPPPAGELRVVSRAGLVLLLIVLGATWLGASNAIREIVKELAIFRRERAAGLAASAYVSSKMLVLGALTALQSMLLVAIATARQDGPVEGSLLGWPLGELMIAAALAGLAGVSLGLLVSALAGTADRAMTVLPVVLVVEMLLALGGLFPDLVDKPVLRQARELASTQWAFSAAASTADLQRLQSFDAVAQRLPSVRVEDPLAVLEAISEPAAGERRWRHDWPTWLADAGALLALTVGGLVATVAALHRRRSEP